MKRTNQQIVKSLWPTACLLGYFSNYRVVASYHGGTLGRGRLQRDAWADAAKNIKEVLHASPLS